MTAQTISHYKLLSKLGAGGMGEVHLAEDMNLGRKVALKLLPSHFTSDEDLVLRFKYEARMASALKHQSIPTVYEIGIADGVHFIAMEYIDGETLRQRMQDSRLPIPEAVDIAIKVASALAAAHARGIVHRDIKPENIMIDKDETLKVLDFGLAKLTRLETDADSLEQGVKTRRGIIVGTPHYMSPEQIYGRKVDGRTDIFSLGIVLYEMISGVKPFRGEDVLSKICQSQPAPLSQHSQEAPGELEAIISEALCKERDDRYQTIEEMQRDLEALKQKLQGRAQDLLRPIRSGSGEEPTIISDDQIVPAQKKDVVLSLHKYRWHLLLLPLLLVAAYLAYVILRPSQSLPSNQALPSNNLLSNKLVVGVADFSITGDDPKNIAKKFAATLFNELESRMGRRKNLPVEIKDCRTGGRDVHLLLIGEVVEDDGEYVIYPKFEQIKPFREKGIEDKHLGPIPLKEVGLKVTQAAATSASDAVDFIVGLAFYKTGNVEEAYEVFTDIETKEASFYKGLCLYEKAAAKGASEAQRRDFLKEAFLVYRSVLQSVESLPDELTAASSVNVANVQYKLSSYCDSDFNPNCSRARPFMKSAIDFYEDALKFYSPADHIQQWAVANNNLASAYIKFASFVDLDQRKSYFDKAKSVYETVLKENSLEPQHRAMIESNLGNLYLEQGSEMADGREYLQNAINNYYEALRVYTREEYPDDWAMVQSNLGIAQTELGRLLDDDGAKKMLKEAEAAYESALEVCTQNDFPSDWAMAKNGLGYAFIERAVRTEGQERLDLLTRAKEACSNALQVYSQDNFPSDWALTQNNLAYVFRELGKQDETQRAAHLSAAVQACEAALRVYTRNDYPKDWATTNINLGDSLRDQGTCFNDSGKLDDAKRAYENALKIISSESYPAGWSHAKKGLGCVLAELGSHAGGLKNLNDSITCFDSALSIYGGANGSRSYKSIIESRQRAAGLRDSTVQQQPCFFWP